jgi:hypothetical protein
LAFDGALLGRGFWLYVWEIHTPEGGLVHYVGRTGDSSSPNAQSPFSRLSAHLGTNPRSSALRRHLAKRKFAPESCRFRLVAHGPLLPEADTLGGHRSARDVVAAFEKALSEELRAGGYDVLNTVDSLKTLDEAGFAPVRVAFAQEFPKLAQGARG